VPSLVDRGARLSVSVTSAASALAAARLFPWNVRSTYRLRLVIGSRPACTRSCHDSSPRCRIEPEMASPRPVCPSECTGIDGQMDGQLPDAASSDRR